MLKTGCPYDDRCPVVKVRRVWIRRLASLGGATLLAGPLAGCSLLSGIKFTNVSDSWLNVSFYTGETNGSPEGTSELYRQRAVQVEPGASAHYRPPGDLVHIQVDTVSPTWEPTGRRYALELLTEPPIHVVASGRAEKLEFLSFGGEIAIIPDREVDGGRFAYHESTPIGPAPQETEGPPMTGAADGPASWDD